MTEKPLASKKISELDWNWPKTTEYDVLIVLREWAIAVIKERKEPVKLDLRFMVMNGIKPWQQKILENELNKYNKTIIEFLMDRFEIKEEDLK